MRTEAHNIVEIYNIGNLFHKIGLTEKARLYRTFAYAFISPEVRK